MEIIRVEIIEEDIVRALLLTHSSTSHFEQFTPACSALARITRSKWCTMNAGILLEEILPFRCCTVPPDLKVMLEKFLITGEMARCCFIAHLNYQKPLFSRHRRGNE